MEAALSTILTAEQSGEKCGGGGKNEWKRNSTSKFPAVFFLCTLFPFVLFLLLSQSLIFEVFAHKPSRYKRLSV